MVINRWNWILLAAGFSVTGVLAQEPARPARTARPERRETQCLDKKSPNKEATGRRMEMPKADRAKLMKKFDADKDGKLNETEREAAKSFREERQQKWQEMQQQRQAKRLEQFDADKDGKLNEAEHAVAREFNQKRRQDMMKKYDLDGDGQLSPEERKAMGKDRRPDENVAP